MKDKGKTFDIQIDAEFNNAEAINTCEIELIDKETGETIEIKKDRKIYHEIERLGFSEQDIENYNNKRTHKQAVIVQIKGYNPDDKTYIYVSDIQLEKMKNANVNYRVNSDGTIEIGEMSSSGSFIYQCEKEGQKFEWFRLYENRVSDEDCLLVDWLRQQGCEATMTYRDTTKEERKNLPTITFQLYGHFLLVDLHLLFKQGTDFYQDLRQAYLEGRITQTRRLVGNTKIGEKLSLDCCYFNNWILKLDDVDYKVAFTFIDTVALHGQATLAELCNNTGVNIVKEIISDDEIKDMSATHLKDPYKVHKYGGGDLVMTEILMNNAEMMKEPYKNFNVMKGYKPPAPTIGKTVKELFESIIADFCGEDLEKFNSYGERKTDSENPKYSKEDFFENKTYKASADYLSKLGHPGCNAYTLSKCFGGMIRNHRPNINHIKGALSDKDFTSAYATTMSQLIYPIGNPIVLSISNSDNKKEKEKQKNTTLRQFLKNRKNNLEDNLYVIIIKTPNGIPLRYEQVLLPSWNRERPIDGEWYKMVQDSEDYVNTGVINLDSGYVKILSKQLINAPLVSANVDYIENELTKKQQESLYNDKGELIEVGFYDCEVIAAAFYDKKQRVNTYQELEDIQNKKIDQTEAYNGETILNASDCHAWTSFKLGNIVDKLTAKRNSYSKEDPRNNMYKLLNNTLYGDQVSQYFLTSNMIVGNNITAILRQQMYYSKTSLYMYGAITDGSISNDNEVFFPKYTKEYIERKRLFEYTALPFPAIDCLKPVFDNVEHENCVYYNNNHYLLSEFATILNSEIKNSGFKYFPQSLILKIKPIGFNKGEYINKEKMSKLYKYTNREIYSNNIGHIKPLIGNTPIELKQDEYIINNKSYLIDESDKNNRINEGKKLIEKAATEHPRKIWKNNQLLNGFYFGLEKTNDGKENYKLRQGLHSIEIKKPIIETYLQGQSNYHFIDFEGKQETKKRGYENLKRKHTAFYFNDSKTKIITDDLYYSKEAPGTKGMKADSSNYPHFHPFIKPQIIKPKAFQANTKKWKNSTLIPGEESYKVFFMRPLSLSQYTFFDEEQRNSWQKDDDAMKKIYSYGLELYFLNDDRTFNIKVMNETLIKLIDEGKKHPRNEIDLSRNLSKVLKQNQWIFENHHAINLMKKFINNAEMDDYVEEIENYNDEFENDNYL